MIERVDVSDEPAARATELGWKLAFTRTLERLADRTYVEKGASAVALALDELVANEFVQAQLSEVARSGNLAAISIITSGQFPLDNGQSLTVDPGWKLTHVEDRHQLWLIQQWRLVRDCAAEWKRGQGSSALEALLPRLREWAEGNLVPDATERTKQLNWHDHTTGLRAVNLVWLGCLLHASHIPSQRYLSLLFELIEVHTAVLSAGDFYSVGTNHGFDQAYGLYLMSCAFPVTEGQQAGKELARARLNFELGCAFNEEGVHIENSPSYHVTMMARLLRAERLLETFDGAAPAGVTRTIENAIRFLMYAWKPDGTLPLLGDSETVPVRIELDLLKDYQGFDELSWVASNGKRGQEPNRLHAVFPRAGYAFFRDCWPSPAKPHALHLAFKCGYLSQYHRHDDDNTILLFAFGEDWLLGSGIYKYHEQDELRKYVRSAPAHNIMSVENVVCSRVLRTAASVMYPATTQGGRTTVQAESNMFLGFGYTRRLSYDQESAQVEILDAMQPSDQERHTFTLRFHVPGDRELTILSPKRVRVSSKNSGKAMLIDLDSEPSHGIEVACGQVTPPLGWTSPQRGVLRPAKTIGFRFSAVGRVEVTSRLSFEQDCERAMQAPAS